MPVLSSSVVAAIDDLELAARLIVEGARSGQHRSPFHGFTATFSQHRPYRPGDDIKHLDWKLLARTNRLYTRQFSETTNLAVMLVLDASASMDFPAPPGGSDDAAVPSKFRYAITMAAALAYLIITSGDAVGLFTESQGRPVYLPARGGRSHLRAVLTALARLQPAGAWSLDRAIARGADLLKRRGVMLVLSDFYDATETTWRELRRTGRRGHDVGLLQVLSRDEIAFPYHADVEFDDIETGERRHLDADAAAPAYRAAVAGFLEQSRRHAHRDGVEYALWPTDEPPARALRSYLLRREGAATPAAGSARREGPAESARA
jgi:uncharacterized protein (DUF58 family)